MYVEKPAIIYLKIARKTQHSKISKNNFTSIKDQTKSEENLKYNQNSSNVRFIYFKRRHWISILYKKRVLHFFITLKCQIKNIMQKQKICCLAKAYFLSSLSKNINHINFEFLFYFWVVSGAISYFFRKTVVFFTCEHICCIAKYVV